MNTEQKASKMCKLVLLTALVMEEIHVASFGI